MAFVEDFAVFFADFGVVATPKAATPSDGMPRTVIFDRDFIAGLGGVISSTGPQALALTADVASWVPRQTKIVLTDHDTQVYLVTEIQPDGTGLSTVALEAL